MKNKRKLAQDSVYKIIFTVLLLKLLALGWLLFAELDNALATGNGLASGYDATSVRVFAVAIFVCAVFILTLAYVYISGNHRKLKQLVADLNVINQSFRNAEALAAMGHWRRDMSSPDKIHYSDNTYRLFGLEPEEVPFSEFKLLSYVHPDDRDSVLQVLESVRNEHLNPVNTYRIIRTDGQVRHLKTLGKFMQLNGEPILLGATRDITEEVESSLAIQKKNKELESLVAELASFNHIASHDLQNPLRKIQMFASRLKAEDDNLSADGKEFCNRIAAAAGQMERLIDDLLLYSETGSSEKVFERTYCDEILEEARQELAAEIKESHAIVVTEQLPVIEAIPFQIRQLFVNLIGNSIKYAQSGLAPVIEITCTSNVVCPEAPGKYYRISVKDNGIGFKQEDASKIFVLFRRLHKKGAYEGTGIGLAICKKIMENHNGYIIAHGTPGQGAVFHLYFPKTQQGLL